MTPLYLLAMFFNCIFLSNATPLDQLHDLRDNQKYKTITIGTQTWMAENLKFRSQESTCYNRHPFPCRKYGRLYNWEEAQSVCPEGWRLPNDEDWNRLYRNFGNIGDAYAAMMDGGSSGFNGKFGGWFTQNKSYKHAGERGYFWSATEMDEENARYYRLDKTNKSFISSNTKKEIGFSCRCIK